ncbi:MAG: hypothetical protein A2169_01255 [Deltaproteobacteria bacterium RBG_13_47_9]|nr:MAG: hypothetical protein A2169_01255 [Deltaproteobacteria bacterium RBG_13_47_9]
MGEIKSTLELAMERTKRFSISNEEKAEIKRKEILRKVASLFNRYLEGHLPLNEILREIERMEEMTAKVVKESLLSQWIDALSLNGEYERLIKGIESLKQQGIDKVKEEFYRLLSQYQKEKKKLEEELNIQFTEALRRDGIYGSAVEPKLEGGELWKKEKEKLDHSYRTKLEEIQEQLRAL